MIKNKQKTQSNFHLNFITSHIMKVEMEIVNFPISFMTEELLS